jgi:hypothetical protein
LDRVEDPLETNSAPDEIRGRGALEALRAALEELSAPREQLERLAIA